MILHDTEKIVESIRSNDPYKRTKALESIYDKCYVQVESYVLKNKGSKSDAQDIFQDGVSILYFNITTEKFLGKSSVSTYLLSICKNLWLQEIRKGVNNFSTLSEYDESLLEDITECHVNSKTLESLLEELKGDCQDILMGFYYQKKSMEELAKQFDLGSTQAAKNKKFRCLTFLSNLISKKELEPKYFID